MREPNKDVFEELPSLLKLHLVQALLTALKEGSRTKSDLTEILDSSIGRSCEKWVHSDQRTLKLPPYRYDFLRRALLTGALAFCSKMNWTTGPVGGRVRISGSGLLALNKRIRKRSLHIGRLLVEGGERICH